MVTAANSIQLPDMVQHIRQYAKNRFATFATQDKVPIKAGVDWKNSPIDVFCDPAQYPYGEFGVVLPADILVVDLDPCNMKDRKIWSEIKEFCKIPEIIQQNTMTVNTHSGGIHLYFRKPANLKIRKSLKQYPGIEFLSSGAYIIGAGSINFKSKKPYSILSNPFKFMDAPQSLLDLITKVDTVDDIIGVDKDNVEFNNSQNNVDRYTDYVRNFAPTSIEGEQGDVQTFKVACRGRDYSLSSDVTFEIMLEHYNSKCIPPWHPEDLKTKVKNAYAYNEAPVGRNDPEVVFSGVAMERFPQKSRSEVFSLDTVITWDKTSKGALKPTMRNCAQLIGLDSKLNMCFGFNEFERDIQIISDVPWQETRDSSRLNFSNADCQHLKFYLACKYNVDISTNTIFDALLLLATKRTFHPVREYLETLTWDREKRLDNWLPKYAGCPETPYSTMIGQKVLLGAVARVYSPGCKFDNVLILEGKQRIGKSTLIAVLGSPWFSDQPFDIRHKDAVETLKGKWIVEFAEVEALKKGDVCALKGFISRQVDRVRPAYLRTAEDFPRQCIFIGTVNPDGSGYLRDDTGNGRYWPVECGRINIKELKKVMPQLWAEAVVRYKAGDKTYLDADMEAVAEEVVKEREVRHPWIEPIAEYFNQHPETLETTTKYVYENVLYGNLTSLTIPKMRDIAKCLRHMGWSKHILKTESGTMTQYIRPSMPMTIDEYKKTLMESLNGK